MNETISEFPSVPFVRYIGRKALIAEKITSYIPEHDCYGIIFGGAGSTLWTKEPSKTEVYNDIWDGIFFLFQFVRDDPETLQDYLDNVIYSREQQKVWKIKLKKGEFLTDVERASAAFFLLNASFDGDVFGGFSTGRRTGRPKTFRNKVLDLKKYSGRLKHTILENIDFRRFIVKYDGPDTIFYADPPYYGVKYYLFEFDYRDHYHLAKYLSRIEGKAIVSYYPGKEVYELYPEPEWRRILIPTKKASTYEEIDELLLLNFDPEEIQLPETGRTLRDWK